MAVNPDLPDRQDITLILREPEDPDYIPRINTKSPFDFAYWAALNATNYDASTVADVTPVGVLNGAELVAWCGSQIGISLPSTYDELVAAIASVDVSNVISERGALVYNDTMFAVTIGFRYIVMVVGDHYYIRHFDSVEESSWISGARVPGVIY